MGIVDCYKELRNICIILKKYKFDGDIYVICIYILIDWIVKLINITIKEL